MKTCLMFAASLLAFQASAGTPAFPTSPDLQITPGSLCESNANHRYPEQIRYCNRGVSSATKIQIFKTYDETLGYRTREMKRNDFKIDHYIPLCMGGSNNPNNLWPQHLSVGQETDLLEMFSCQKMADGRLRQAEAIDIMKQAKADISRARDLLHYVQGL